VFFWYIFNSYELGLDDTDTLYAVLRRGAKDGKQGEDQDGSEYFP
jgi:hypothetical protein